MKTFIQFNQLSYYTNRELGNVYKKKKNSVFISYEIRKAVQQRRSDKVKKLVKFQQTWIGPRFVASYIQIKGSAHGHFHALL